jgi:hypothetical protein
MLIRWLRAIEKTIAALSSRKIQFFEQYASPAKGLGPTGMGHLYCGQALLDPVVSTFSGKTSII